MAQLQGYLTRCNSDVITGTIWTFLERRGTVGICLIAPNPKLVPAVDGKVHWQYERTGEAWNSLFGRGKRGKLLPGGSALQIADWFSIHK